MREIAVLYSIIGVVGIYCVVADLIRLFTARNVELRRRAKISLLGSFMILVICVGVMWVGPYLEWWVVTVTSGILLALNYILFQRLLQSDLN